MKRLTLWFYRIAILLAVHAALLAQAPALPLSFDTLYPTDHGMHQVVHAAMQLYGHLEAYELFCEQKPILKDKGESEYGDYALAKAGRFLEAAHSLRSYIHTTTLEEMHYVLDLTKHIQHKYEHLLRACSAGPTVERLLAQAYDVLFSTLQAVLFQGNDTSVGTGHYYTAYTNFFHPVKISYWC